METKETTEDQAKKPIQFREDEFYDLDEDRLYKEQCERILDGLPCFKKEKED